jgi:hypothetical protein
LKDIRERFEDNYIPIPESGCWLWEAMSDDQKYDMAVGWANEVVEISFEEY